MISDHNCNTRFELLSISLPLLNLLSPYSLLSFPPPLLFSGSPRELLPFSVSHSHGRFFLFPAFFSFLSFFFFSFFRALLSAGCLRSGPAFRSQSFLRILTSISFDLSSLPHRRPALVSRPPALPRRADIEPFPALLSVFQAYRLTNLELGVGSSAALSPRAFFRRLCPRRGSSFGLWLLVVQAPFASLSSVSLIPPYLFTGTDVR